MGRRRRVLSTKGLDIPHEGQCIHDLSHFDDENMYFFSSISVLTIKDDDDVAASESQTVSKWSDRQTGCV